MTTWTDAARQRLARYFDEIRGSLKATGADPNEVCDDLRRHLDEEVAARKLEVVTEEDVRQILARIGAPDAAALASNPPPAPAAAVMANMPATPTKPSRHWLLLAFGVVLPAITVAIEMFTHICAGVFFDPIPSWWHVLLVAAVPAANLWVWGTVRAGRTDWPVALGLANGFATGIAGFYALLYLPILPFALIGVFYLGWGLMPMAPLFGLIAALRLRRQARRLSGEPQPLPALWPGLGLAALALALTIAPITWTRILAQRAASESPAQRASAIEWLRALGHETTLLGDCYGTTEWMRQSPIDFHLFGVPVTPEQARATYFRVTGRPFNSQPPPQLNYTRGGWTLLDDLTWDREQGGEVVGSRIKGLSVATSRIDGLVEGDAALGYLEWTMEFRNTSRRQREARAQIALPPGGVVSRLTLWVNGEEREAAFAGRAHVREAYQQVAIRQRRDPVLVTSAGPDRVLVQCFPVPPDGGTMKIRLGITAPLVMENQSAGVLLWPHFLERNFTLADDFTHSLWVESSVALESRASELRGEHNPTARNSLRGNLADRQLDEPASALRARRSSDVALVWTPETSGTNHGVIEQTLVQQSVPVPGRVVLVVDGSRSMREHLPAIAEALKQFPAGIELSVLLAADEVVSLRDQPVKATATVLEDLARQLRRAQAAGGQDNVPALLRAWDLAAQSPGGVVVWIHGPQPVLLDQTDLLAQRFLWRGEQTRLYDFQTATGPNRIAEKLDGLRAVTLVPRRDSVKADLGNLFALWNGQGRTMALVRQKTAGHAPGPAKGREVSQHLARLWAAGEVSRLTEQRLRDAAVRLAAVYQLVTPVSGAVVLETQEQFERAGLEPVEASTVPNVPESAALWWLALGLATAVAACRKLGSRLHI